MYYFVSVKVNLLCHLGYNQHYDTNTRLDQSKIVIVLLCSVAAAAAVVVVLVEVSPVTLKY